MARIARIVAEGVPHHITQRGNGRQTIFDDAQDHHVYLKLLRQYTGEYGLRIWAWCLMSNHVHLLAVPETGDSLARAMGRIHCDYARYRNARAASCGHLWQARYYSCPVDGPAVWRVMAYIERNPVRAGLVETAEEFPWSSARAHATDREDGFLAMAPWRGSYNAARWREALYLGIDDEILRERLRSATRTGRPFGSEEFLDEIERNTSRTLRPRQVGRPRKIAP
ncbi:MAG TPA: transposase [Bryobacteraceae bacterium]|jgi:putative transposase|nr:transposase [Bryobacteraceae bacterium]